MMRWLGFVALSAGLALGACGSSEKKTEEEGPGFEAAPPEQALPGSWTDGTNTITFDPSGSYRWEEARECGAPPCPTTATSGTWKVNHGMIYLDPEEGGDEVIEFGFMDQQKGLSLSSKTQGRTWSLKKQ